MHRNRFNHLDLFVDVYMSTAKATFGKSSHVLFRDVMIFVQPKSCLFGMAALRSRLCRYVVTMLRLLNV